MLPPPTKTMPALEPVTSENIAAIGYDGDLYVKFHDDKDKPGATWKYFGVPADLHEGLMKAHSVNTAFRHTIKGQFRAEKMLP